MAAHTFARGKSEAEAAAAAHGRSRVITIALLGAALLLGFALCYFITRSLLRQLGGEPAVAAEAARAVAGGDLKGLAQQLVQAVAVFKVSPSAA
jgi:uncharacterized protein YneF (UPF0154 family)